MNKKSLVFLLVLVILPALVVVPEIPKSYAHAFVQKSDPQNGESLSTPPSSVNVYLNDPVDVHYSKIQVFDSNGKEVDNKDYHYVGSDQTTLSVSLPSLPNGVYTVNVKMLDQTDGHVTKDGFVFAVGQPVPITTNATSASPNLSDIISAPEAVARFPTLLGQVIVVGGAFSALWIWKPVSRISWLSDAFGKTKLAIDKKMTKLMLVGAATVVGSDIAMISVEAYSINASILDAIATKFGQMWTVRIILSVALLAIVLLAYFEERKSQKTVPRRTILIILGLGLAVLATTSLISHGAATGQWSPLVFDFVHNVAASLWIGGVFYLDFVVLSKLRKDESGELSTSILSVVIPRFSIVVLAILGTVAITGPLLLYSLENNLALTLASVYGKILVIKLSLAAVMLAAGGYHQMVIHKRVVRTMSATKNGASYNGHGSHKSILSKFGWSVKIESIAGILLIASVAVLVDSGLPATEFQNQLQQISSLIPSSFATNDNPIPQDVFTETRYAQNGSRVEVSLTPFFAGKNNMQISFLDSNKNPINIESAKLTFTQVDRGIGPITVDANATSLGRFFITTDTLAIPGHWNLQVEGIQTVANAVNVVGSFDDLYVKPQVSQITANIKEYYLPQNGSLPLYPLYDKSRNVVWLGDAKLNSSRLYSFDLSNKTFVQYGLPGVDIVTLMTMDDRDNTIWYVDPISKLLGHYNPDDKSNQLYKIPSSGILSAIMMDDSNNIWLSISSLSNDNEILRFNTTANDFAAIPLPANSLPQGLVLDKISGKVWVAESGIGKIAMIDPSDNSVVEYPNLQNGTLSSPTSMLYDDVTGKILVSEHEGAAVSVFDPLLKTFTRYHLDPNGLPFGIAFDKNHDLWVAQHTLDKMAVLDTRTGQTNEYDIPTKSSSTQYITVDSQGEVILAEERAHAVGILTTSVNPSASQLGNVSQSANSQILSIVNSPLHFSTVAAPSIAAGLIAVAFFYSKSVLDLKKCENMLKGTRSGIGNNKGPLHT
ncbi:MAG: copper resistance protein CopC [Thaumarchaeota archaeon]|nr:copper resistance protein CopC [Nitrososphaerota archaeon]